MKTLLIIYPHWVPSNLTGVHRVRLIANFLPEFNVHPILLTVRHNYYEEKHDWDMLKTVSDKIEVISVEAHKIRKPRIIGDIGLRAFSQLKREALNIIQNRKIDFLWVPIPSFYVAVLARILHNKTNIPYGIDYIDPWVRDISNRKNMRAIMSNIAARILEPYSVKKASLISSVSVSYYQPVLNKYFKQKHIEHIAMPYGFDPNDHNVVLDNLHYPWEEFNNCIPLVYAGAFLPKSDLFTKLLFRAISQLKTEHKWNDNIKLFFLGTGNYSHKSILDFAKEHGIDNSIVEIRERFPFLHILNFLSAAKGLILLGSTEEHYTASKTYQYIISKTPIFSILHTKSSAVKVLKDCNAATYICEYSEELSEDDMYKLIKTTFYNFINIKYPYKPKLKELEQYSAKTSAKILIDAINRVLKG